MSDIPNWLRGTRPQLSHVTNNGPDYWALTIWSHMGASYELRVRVNMDSDIQGRPIDRYDFYTREDDHVSDWKEVVTHENARENCDQIECYACDEVCNVGHAGGPCPNVEAAVKKYVETHHMVYGDSAIWEVKQHLLRHWHAISLLVSIGP